MGNHVSAATDAQSGIYSWTGQQRNAFSHAYGSAELAFTLGPNAALLAGAIKEMLPINGESEGNWDTYKDLYNNEAGRQIGTWARENGLTLEDVRRLTAEALNRGDLISNRTDPRLPPFSNESPIATGSPFDFTDSNAWWKGPDGDWVEQQVIPNCGVQPAFEGFRDFSSQVLRSAFRQLILENPLFANKMDPLILDLDGDGIELIALSGSSAHFDYGQDGFAERTGWVALDDGILVIDDNANGTVDGAAELFGSPTQDGFEVLSPLGRMAVASAAVSACTCGRIAA